MFSTIMNGLTNSYSSSPICICDEIDEEDFDEIYDNTYVTDEEVEKMCRQNDDEDYDSSEMYAIF